MHCDQCRLLITAYCTWNCSACNKGFCSKCFTKATWIDDVLRGSVRHLFNDCMDAEIAADRAEMERTVEGLLSHLVAQVTGLPVDGSSGMWGGPDYLGGNTQRS